MTPTATGPSADRPDDQPDADLVGAVLDALADPTRRAIFETVARHGPVTATAIARERTISRQAISKHLERLDDAGLVTSERVGRETRWSATPEPLAAATGWFDSIRSAWDDRLTSLAAMTRRRA